MITSVDGSFDKTPTVVSSPTIISKYALIVVYWPGATTATYTIILDLETVGYKVLKLVQFLGDIHLFR